MFDILILNIHQDTIFYLYFIIFYFPFALCNYNDR